MASLHRTIAHHMAYEYKPKRVRKPAKWTPKTVWHPTSPIQIAQMTAHKKSKPSPIHTLRSAWIADRNTLQVIKPVPPPTAPVTPPKHGPIPVQKPPTRGGLFARVKNFVNRRKGM